MIDPASQAGSIMAAEMAEQPAVITRQLDNRQETIRAVNDARPNQLQGVVIVARGSSDNAAVFGSYLLERATGRPVAMVTPSTHTLYGAQMDYRGYLAIAVSQSGQTPEIISVLSRIVEAGGQGLAVTNDVDSNLAVVAHAVVALEAGHELAIPATKTYTAQLAAFALIASVLGPTPFTEAQLANVPQAMQCALDRDNDAQQAARKLLGFDRLAVVARGYLLAAAYEAALKVKETCAIWAQGFSAADIAHGPIAAVTHDVGVLTLLGGGTGDADITALLRRLHGRTVIEIGPTKRADMPTGDELPEALTCFPTAVRVQQLACLTALLRGMNPDQPAALTKVTATH